MQVNNTKMQHRNISKSTIFYKYSTMLGRVGVCLLSKWLVKDLRLDRRLVLHHDHIDGIDDPRNVSQKCQQQTYQELTLQKLVTKNIHYKKCILHNIYKCHRLLAFLSFVLCLLYDCIFPQRL